VYDATGPGGGPGNLKASTASFTPVKGWNTQNVTFQTLIPAGTYWLAYLPSSNSLSFLRTSTGPIYYYTLNSAYPFPASFAASTATKGLTTWSFYASLTVTSSPTPTPVPPPSGYTVTYDQDRIRASIGVRRQSRRPSQVVTHRKAGFEHHQIRSHRPNCLGYSHVSPFTLMGRSVRASPSCPVSRRLS